MSYQDPSQAGRSPFPPRGAESSRPYVSDRIIRRGLEYEEALPEGPFDTNDQVANNEEQEA